MNSNKTKPTGVNVESFLVSVSESRRSEARVLTAMMQKISREKAYMWGASIIGFGLQHYKYHSGREGDMPRLAFSPREANITVYFSEGFDRYAHDLTVLGKHRQSVSCLYIRRLSDINLDVLQKMLEQSFSLSAKTHAKPTTVDEYLATIPVAARPKFDELRQLVQDTLPHGEEVPSYGIVGYKIDDKRPRVYISGWKDHVAMYPVPKDETLQMDMKPYIKGRGTLWFGLSETLPKPLIQTAVKVLGS